MKKTFLKTIGGVALAISLLTVFATQKALSDQGGGGRLDGTWEVQLQRRNCQTGAALGTPIPELATFMSGGTMIASTAGVPQALKTPAQGVWSHVSENTYSFSAKSLNFDSAGNFSGWSRFAQEITLNSNATEYTSEGTVEVFSAGGVSVFKGCSTATATRLE
ncbi:MAG TPA: hypothetical protein VE135_28210 [Pyrinomonadaceae bacterium]|nr:hypothetical protein [Pyrinomonadaceae bacterium]